MRLKDVAILNPKYDGEDLDNELVSFSPMECLRYDNLRPYTIPFKNARGKYTYFANNDVLFAKVTPCFENLNTAIASNLLNGIGFGSSEINVLRFSDKCYTRYFFYLICSRQFIDKGCASMSGVGGLKRVNPLAVTTFEFELPPRFEQEIIADCLDKECDKITKEIDLLERKIKCYHSLQNSLINKVVTRGLNPNVSMKQSEIPFLNEIPEHWHICRIKDLFNERIELSETGTEDLLSVSEYYGVAKRADKVDGENITRSDSLIGYKICYVNDIISNIMLAWKGSLGKTKYNGIVSPAYGVYKPIVELNASFYHYLFRTKIYKGIFRINSRGIIESRLRLYTTNFLGLSTVYPPIEEQNGIVNYLDEKCSKIDAIIEKIKLKIERLKELKRSLINEVITGQRTIKTSDL